MTSTTHTVTVSPVVDQDGFYPAFMATMVQDADAVLAQLAAAWHAGGRPTAYILEHLYVPRGTERLIADVPAALILGKVTLHGCGVAAELLEDGTCLLALRCEAVTFLPEHSGHCGAIVLSMVVEEEERLLFYLPTSLFLEEGLPTMIDFSSGIFQWTFPVVPTRAA